MPADIPRTPKVSVVTVAFNAGIELAKTAESVVSQTYAGMEYVVIDGGSKDGSLERLAEHMARVDVFVSEPDHGIYDAMNKGIARSTGQYIIFMNSGDCFAGPDALSCAVSALAGTGEQVVFGSWIRRARGRQDLPVRPSLDKARFNHQAVLYSRSLHHKYGPYVNVPGLSTADYLFFATLLSNGEVRFATTDAIVAVIDVGGVSAGVQTFSQKQAIDYLLGRIGRWHLLLAVAVHPAYRRVKRWVGLAP